MKSNGQARYARLNGKYLKHAQRLLKRGDLSQASEKFWGAAAEIVKAVAVPCAKFSEAVLASVDGSAYRPSVAADQGKGLGTHRHLWNYLTGLHMKHPELNLLPDFHVAETLHVNFYEDHLSKAAVASGGKVVERFVRKLNALR